MAERALTCRIDNPSRFQDCLATNGIATLLDAPFADEVNVAPNERCQFLLQLHMIEQRPTGIGSEALTNRIEK